MKAVAFIRKITWSIPVLLDCGDYNGYVAIPPGNKYYGKSYGEITLDIDVHGGLTYSEPVILGEKTFVAGIPISPEYIGKRNYILEDAEYITDNTEIGDDCGYSDSTQCTTETPLKNGAGKR